MTSLLYGNCVQLKQQNGHCILSSSRRPKSLLPNRERHVVSSEPRSFSSHSSSRPSVQQPNVYYEVFTRPIVLSRRHGCVTTSVDQRLALQSLSDSNVVASAKSRMSRRTDRWKPELSNGDAKLYRNICLPSVVGSVTSKNCDGALTSNVPLSHEEAACHQADCQFTSDEVIRIGSRRETKSATVIRRNSNSGSLTHIPSDTTGHSEIGHDNTCHSLSETIVDRSVQANGSRPHVSTSDDDRVFLEKMTKIYKQRRKTGNGRTSGAIRRSKIAHGTGFGSTDRSRTAGLCLVGQSIITAKESKNGPPANENSMQNKNAISIPTSADCCSEVNGVSQQSLRQIQLRRLQVVISDHQQTAAAAAADDDDAVVDDDDYPMANSDKGNFLFRPCAVDVPGDCSSGKNPV